MMNRYRQHILEVMAWLTFLFLPMLLFPAVYTFDTQGHLNPVLRSIFIAHSLLTLLYYFNFYYAIPKFYFANKEGIFALMSLAFFLVLCLFLYSDPQYNPFPSPPFKYPGFTFFLSILLRFFLVMLISLGIANIQRLKQTEREKLQTELSYLKSQINPHFLFNTLNSIYSLTLKKSEAGPEAVTKLSSIMRYAISDASGDLVALEKEITYLNAYIDLERLRITNKVHLKFEVNGDLRGKRIAPLIFIPLVENAFKFGVSTRDESEITINILVEKQHLRLFIRNTKPRAQQNSSTGIGLANVKRRLGIIYAGKHHLKMDENSAEFSVTLDLDLHD